MIGPIQSSKTKLLLRKSNAEDRRVQPESHYTISLPRKFSVQRSAVPFLAQAAPRSRPLQPARPQPRRVAPEKVDPKTTSALKVVVQYARGKTTAAKAIAALNYLYSDGELSKAHLTTLLPLLRRLVRSSYRGVADAAIKLYASFARSKQYFTGPQVHRCAKDLRALFTRSDTVIRESAAFHYAADVAHRLDAKGVRAEAKALRKMFRRRSADARKQAVYAYRKLAPWVNAGEARAGAKALRKLFLHSSYGVRMYAREAYAYIARRLKATDVLVEAKSLRYLSKRRSARVRKCAVEALGHIAARLKGSKRGRSTRALLARLKDRAAVVRKYAARSLGGIAATSTKAESQRVAKAIRLSLFNDRWWEARLEGIQTYEKHFSKLNNGERALGVTAIKRLMNDKDGQVKVAAVKVYGEKYVPAMNKAQMRAAVDILMPLTSDENTSIKWYAQQALKLIADRVGTKPVSTKTPRPQPARPRPRRSK